MASLESRIAKLEEILTAPDCNCSNYRLIILNELHRPVSEAELEEFHRLAHMDCPVHGSPQLDRLAIRLRPSPRGAHYNTEAYT